jgi:phosphate transport system protein
LADLGAQLTTMCGVAAAAMDHATQALLETDLVMAEQVITDDDALHVLGGRCEEQACLLLARQSPVARDLRLVVSALKAGERIVRMGDLACHVARIVRLRHPAPAVPDEFAEQFAEMGRLAVEACRDLQRTIADPTSICAEERERADDRTDELHQELLQRVGRADPPYSPTVGVDVALLARFFERYADQAVAVARQLDYVVTGEMPRHVLS